MSYGRQVALRLQPEIDDVLSQLIPARQHAQLLRSLLTLAVEGLKKDPYLLSEILIGGTRPTEYELRVYRKEAPDE